MHFNQSVYDIQKLEFFTEEEKNYIENIVIPFPKGDRLPGHYIRSSYAYSCLIYDALKNRLNEFDFIYSKGFSAWKLIEEKKKDPSKFPPIGVKFHGYEMFQKAGKLIIKIHQMMLKGPVKWVTLHADYAFSYGGKITGLIQKLGVPLSKIVEIPAGIESNWITDHVSETGKTISFTFLGRYERRKGVEELNEAIGMLLKQQVDFTFNFIGPFADSEKIISDKVVYHGLISDNAVLKKKLDDTDVLVCPSWSEGMPNVILEAMARGCAVIATDVGAVSLMVDETNGLLIRPGDVNILFDSLKRMTIIDHAELCEMKKNSVRKIKDRFVYDLIIDKFVSVLQEITSRKQ